MSEPPGIPVPDSEAVFEHDPAGHYLHLFREILLAARAFAACASREAGIPAAQLQVIRELAVSPDGRSHVSTIARDLGVDAAAITRLVAALEKRGLVLRKLDPQDGRRRPVLLSEQGKRLALLFHARQHELERTLASRIDEDSLDTARLVLQQVREILSAASQPGSTAATNNSLREASE